nr:Triple gene block 3 Protein [Daphne virus X]
MHPLLSTIIVIYAVLILAICIRRDPAVCRIEISGHNIVLQGCTDPNLLAILPQLKPLTNGLSGTLS